MSSASVRPLRETLQGYGRGIVGGLLFALAPLYTLEIWWQGFIAPVHYLLVAVFATVVLLVAYAYYAGLHVDRSLRRNVVEAFETLALGFLVAYVVLQLVGQLGPSLSLREVVTRLTIEGLTTSIGVAIGSAQLGEQRREGDEDDEALGAGPLATVHQLAYSALGAMVIVASFSTTMEIVMIALEAPAPAVLGAAVLSYLLALSIVSYLDFRGAQRVQGSLYAGGAWGDACVTYAIALVVSAALLWTAGRFTDVGFGPSLYMTVYLALPATVGASVGRLLL